VSEVKVKDGDQVANGAVLVVVDEHADPDKGDPGAG
jgi:pyruvate/2-oxoglutarate dehydrogenase complex dihydrolipoamide acyltransferase (E2) component